MKGVVVLALALTSALCAMPLGDNITVKGRVEISNASAARSDFSGAVVWLTPVGNPAPIVESRRQTRRQLVQKSKSFSPHLLVVPVGSSVEFPNQDPFFHNVFSLFEGRRFDLGLYESGSSRSVAFNREGISYIFCNIHAEMSAVVIALKTPFYGISDRAGEVVIPNVAIGAYELQIWHERVLPDQLKAAIRKIHVAPNSDSFGVLRLTEERTLQRHKNKYGHDYDPTPNNPAYPHP